MIKSFEIAKYRQFESAKFDNFSNINLFIGENDTEKTTILKFLYANCSELREIVYNLRTPQSWARLNLNYFSTFL